MSLTGLRSYYNARCKALDLREHEGSFNTDNIASTIIDNSFFVEFSAVSPVKQNQLALELSAPVTVHLFKKGYRDEKQGVDDSISLGENLIKEVLKSTNRLGSSAPVNIQFNGLTYQAFGASNDNLIETIIDFTNIVAIDVDN